LDSGLGGLTVVRRVRERMPDADLVFFADQAHVPYGPRTPDDLHDLLVQNLLWLEARDLDAIVIACNTSCAIADRYGWPATRAPIFDLIDSATVALRGSDARRIGVVATAATVRSGAYGRRIRDAIPGSEVVEIAAPALVPLVEAGEIEGDAARAAVADVCANLPADVDTVVLACTHYPILDAHFQAVLGPSVVRIDPAFVQADRVAAFLGERGASGSGTTEYVTNGDEALFRRNIARLMPGSATALVTPAL
jgi:glutamate racemase